MSDGHLRATYNEIHAVRFGSLGNPTRRTDAFASHRRLARPASRSQSGSQTCLSRSEEGETLSLHLICLWACIPCKPNPRMTRSNTGLPLQRILPCACLAFVRQAPSDQEEYFYPGYWPVSLRGSSWRYAGGSRQGGCPDSMAGSGIPRPTRSSGFDHRKCIRFINAGQYIQSVFLRRMKSMTLGRFQCDHVLRSGSLIATSC